jgi:signal transduction histidine kinase
LPLIEGAIAVSASRAELAVRLPWLAPGAAVLAALARSDIAAIDRHLRHDPGFALLWLRAGSSPIDESADLSAMLRAALSMLDSSLRETTVLNESSPAVAVVLDAARACARVAEQLAHDRRFSDPRRAAVSGLLAPLSWLAIAAIDPSGIEECLTDDEHVFDPDRIQNKRWGASAAVLARRLARHWDLPAWLTAAVANFELPPSWSAEIGGDPDLTSIVQDAVCILSRTSDTLNLAHNLTPSDTADCEIELIESNSEPLADPFASPFLREWLTAAVERASTRAAKRIELENEALREKLRTEQFSYSERLRHEKLAALAEFAAGAGHEINNPLAVISGQAQYLLIKEYEPDCEKALHVIIQQAQRIHLILTDLMQYARPAKPQKRPLDLRNAARTVATNLHEFAALQRVRIELITPDESCPIEADPKQVQTALTSLLRNAVEAAPEDGWARVTVELAGESLHVVVEDSGVGPTTAQQSHMFDPFYSGRSAGRGRGLGLPAAWRLAREQGGDVAFDPKPDSPARFVLTLPRAAEQLPVVERKSA